MVQGQNCRVYVAENIMAAVFLDNKGVILANVLLGRQQQILITKLKH
jgi:hypothetical protein